MRRKKFQIRNNGAKQFIMGVCSLIWNANPNAAVWQEISICTSASGVTRHNPRVSILHKRYSKKINSISRGNKALLKSKGRRISVSVSISKQVRTYTHAHTRFSLPLMKINSRPNYSQYVSCIIAYISHIFFKSQQHVTHHPQKSLLKQLEERIFVQHSTFS